MSELRNGERPVYRGLVQPILVMGVSRGVAIFIGCAAVVAIFMLRSMLAIAVLAALFAGLRHLTKRDHQMSEVLQQKTLPGRYDP